MFARIYKPSKTAMQSGKGNSTLWVLEFEAETARRIDPLMGWTSADETAAGQVRLTFESKDKAISYAQRHGLAYRVDPEQSSTAPKAKAYADNFAYRRRQAWTH